MTVHGSALVEGSHTLKPEDVDVHSEAYRAYRDEVDLPRLRLLVTFGSCLYFSFVALDAILYPKWLLTFLLMRSVGLSWGLVIFAVARQPSRLSTARILTQAAATYILVTLGVMCALTEGFVSPYITGHLLIMLAVTSFDIFTPRQHASFIAIGVISLVVLCFAAHPHTPVGPMLASVSFAVGGGVICVLTAMLTHRQSLRFYAMTQALERNNDDLRRATAHQGEFLRTVSHELRTPLNTIAGYAELIATEELSQRSHKHLGRIQTSAHGLLRIINDLLDLSRIAAGRLELRFEPVNVGELLEEVREEAVVMLGRRADSVKVIARCSLDSHVQSDAVRLRQILVNLAHNATKFTHEGSITLSADAVETAGQPQLLIRVSDTGVGIDPQHQRSIFEAFRQTQQGIAAGGTGLGLGIVARLVDLLGGTIVLESEVDRGTTFSMRFPLGQEDR